MRSHKSLGLIVLFYHLILAGLSLGREIVKIEGGFYVAFAVSALCLNLDVGGVHAVLCYLFF